MRKLDFEIDRPGTYAVIFKPKYNVRQKQYAYTSILKKYKKSIILLIFFMMPFIILLIGIMGDIVRFFRTCKDIQDDRLFLKEQACRMLDITADFIGQNIKDKDVEGIEYCTNPMHNSQNIDYEKTKKMNLKFDELELEKLEVIKERMDLLNKVKANMKKIQNFRGKIDELNEVSRNFDKSFSGIDEEPIHVELDFGA